MSADTLNLPALDNLHPVAPGTVARYRLHGHTVLRGLASEAEVAAFRPAILQACERMRYENRPLEERDTYGKAFLQYWGIAQDDEQVRRFVMARRFARVAAELMGVDSVRIYHDQALLKEPQGGPTPLHQDQHYWPLTGQAVTMWMPLVPVPTEVGSMSFVDGTHRLGYLGAFDISDESERAVQQLIADRGLSCTTHGAMAPGDATFHAGWTLHGAPGNPTAKLREVMTVIYLSGDARMTEPKSHQAGDTGLWFKGLKPGDVVGGPQHPVAWSR